MSKRSPGRLRMRSSLQAAIQPSSSTRFIHSMSSTLPNPNTSSRVRTADGHTPRKKSGTANRPKLRSMKSSGNTTAAVVANDRLDHPLGYSELLAYNADRLTSEEELCYVLNSNPPVLDNR